MSNILRKKINVLHIFYSFFLGGAEKLLLDILKNPAVKEDIQYSFAIITGQYDEKMKNELEFCNSKNYIFPLNQHKKRIQTFYKLLKIIKEDQIDIIHCHEESGEKLAFLCKLLIPRLKIISTIHDTNIINSLSKKEILLKQIFVNSHIAISKSVLDECRENGISRATLIYNGIEVSKYNIEKAQIHRASDKLKIINIARLELPKKGQDILIRALNECKRRGLNFNCSFVGGIGKRDTGSLDFLKKLVQDNNLENEITFLGERSDIPQLLAESDLFILPSRFEGFGLVILEAMAAHLPVIASNIDGPRELINHEINGLLFENENYLDLADKITELYFSVEKRNKISESAYYFVQNFDMSAMCKKYSELYKSQMTN